VYHYISKYRTGNSKEKILVLEICQVVTVPRTFCESFCHSFKQACHKISTESLSTIPFSLTRTLLIFFYQHCPLVFLFSGRLATRSTDEEDDEGEELVSNYHHHHHTHEFPAWARVNYTALLTNNIRYINHATALSLVLRIHDILVWIRIWIRGSMPLTNGSRVGIKKPTQKNPKKPTQKNPKKPT
jgi:hypothetical protein